MHGQQFRQVRSGSDIHSAVRGPADVRYTAVPFGIMLLRLSKTNTGTSTPEPEFPQTSKRMHMGCKRARTATQGNPEGL